MVHYAVAVHLVIAFGGYADMADVMEKSGQDHLFVVSLLLGQLRRLRHMFQLGDLLTGVFVASISFVQIHYLVGDLFGLLSGHNCSFLTNNLCFNYFSGYKVSKMGIGT